MSSMFQARRRAQLRAERERSIDEEHRPLVAAHVEEVVRLHRRLERRVDPDAVIEYFDLVEFQTLLWEHTSAVVRHYGLSDDADAGDMERQAIILGILHLHLLGLVAGPAGQIEVDAMVAAEVDAARARLSKLDPERRRSLADDLHDREHAKRLLAVSFAAIDRIQLALQLLFESPEGPGLIAALQRGDGSWVAHRLVGSVGADAAQVMPLRPEST